MHVVPTRVDMVAMAIRRVRMIVAAPDDRARIRAVDAFLPVNIARERAQHGAHIMARSTALADDVWNDNCASVNIGRAHRETSGTLLASMSLDSGDLGRGQTRQEAGTQSHGSEHI
jgi:hypothetical protein